MFYKIINREKRGEAHSVSADLSRVIMRTKLPFACVFVYESQTDTTSLCREGAGKIGEFMSQCKGHECLLPVPVILIVNTSDPRTIKFKALFPSCPLSTPALRGWNATFNIVSFCLNR